jgi:hypothetical protein
MRFSDKDGSVKDLFRNLVADQQDLTDEVEKKCGWQ